jgi:hypothetical protein
MLTRQDQEILAQREAQFKARIAELEHMIRNLERQHAYQCEFSSIRSRMLLNNQHRTSLLPYRLNNAGLPRGEQLSRLPRRDGLAPPVNYPINFWALLELTGLPSSLDLDCN